MARKAPAVDLKAKFRAVSRELRARREGARASGRHSVDKGLRSEGALREFLARLLPPKYGVSRGEVVAAPATGSNPEKNARVVIATYRTLDVDTNDADANSIASEESKVE